MTRAHQKPFCLGGGIIVRQVGVWTSPSAGPGDKPISGITVAELGRHGMLVLNILRRSASAERTRRGSWFARTIFTEAAGYRPFMPRYIVRRAV
jgi:hypothetical protein